MGIAQSSLLGAVGTATAGITAGIGIAKQDELVKGQKEINTQLTKGQQIELTNQGLVLIDHQKKVAEETASIEKSQEKIKELEAGLKAAEKITHKNTQQRQQIVNDLIARTKAIQELKMRTTALTEARNAREVRLGEMLERWNAMKGGSK